MTSDTVDTDTLGTDDMHVVWPRAAGLDVHKMCITAAVRLCEAGSGPARTAVRQFSALPDGLRTMTDWLRGHGVTAAALEGTGVYWQAPFEALEDAGIHADLLHAQHVKQIRGKKTDTNDSLWLTRICQFGLALPSHVPPRLFRQLRQVTRYRRKLVAERSRARSRPGTSRRTPIGRPSPPIRGYVPRVPARRERFTAKLWSFRDLRGWKEQVSKRLADPYQHHAAKRKTYGRIGIAKR